MRTNGELSLLIVDFFASWNIRGEKSLGGNSQNSLGKFVRFFVTLRDFYRVVVHRK